uniref:Uncharacterized protein n=1 Tax=Oryza barthii TaxID=65489 RepID=A0A0D3FUP2_9ORYZ
MATEGGTGTSRPGLQEGRQRQGRCQLLRITCLGFHPKGQRQESNTSKEETTPAGTDVGRPGILGSAFSRDSLKICMTFRMPE